MIVIITNKDDITTDFVVNRLNKMGAEYLRLNTEDLVSGTGISFDIHTNQNSLLVLYKSKILNLSDVKSVYFRRPVLPHVKMDLLSQGENEFLVREISYVLEGLYKALRKCFWMSPVDSIRQAENKIYQLLMAQDTGFEIPHSLITTSADKARAFFEQFGGDCIIKPIKNGTIDDEQNEKVIFTSSLKGRDINWKDAVTLCPIYLQPNIKKTD